jgi:hypothetical protein
MEWFRDNEVRAAAAILSRSLPCARIEGQPMSAASTLYGSRLARVTLSTSLIPSRPSGSPAFQARSGTLAEQSGAFPEPIKAYR